MGMCGHRPPGGPQEPPRGEGMDTGRGAVQVGAHPRMCPLGPVVWAKCYSVSVGQGGARLARAAATGVFWTDLGGPEHGAQGKRTQQCLLLLSDLALCAGGLKGTELPYRHRSMHDKKKLPLQVRTLTFGV